MSKFKFNNGQEAKDIVSGFTGIITSRCDYLTGCNQYCLLAPSKDNAEPVSRWVDENRVEILADGRNVSLPTDETVGGPAESYPSRSA